MADDNRQSDDGTGQQEAPLVELADLRVDGHPDLEGRVHREINRRTFAADSLDFSLNVMLQTFWEHLRSAIDAWPGNRRAGSDSDLKK